MLRQRHRHSFSLHRTSPAQVQRNSWKTPGQPWECPVCRSALFILPHLTCPWGVRWGRAMGRGCLEPMGQGLERARGDKTQSLPLLPPPLEPPSFLAVARCAQLAEGGSVPWSWACLPRGTENPNGLLSRDAWELPVAPTGATR